MFYYISDIFCYIHMYSKTYFLSKIYPHIFCYICMYSYIYFCHKYTHIFFVTHVVTMVGTILDVAENDFCLCKNTYVIMYLIFYSS
jgi:hypothetical protein